MQSGSEKPTQSKKKHLSAFAELRALLEPILNRMPHTFTLRIRRLVLTVGGEDPAKTALLYGGASTALSLLLEWLDYKLLTLRQDRGAELGVRADFEADGSSLSLDLHLYTTPFRMLRLAFNTLLPHYLRKRRRRKAARKKKNTPKSTS